MVEKFLFQAEVYQQNVLEFYPDISCYFSVLQLGSRSIKIEHFHSKKSNVHWIK